MSSSNDDSDSQNPKSADEDEDKISPKKVPDDIAFESIVETIDFHPSKDFISAGGIDGDVTVHSYDVEGKNYEVLLFCHHKRACRAVKFSPDGTILFTASKDKSIAGVDVTSAKLINQKHHAHKTGVYSMLPIDDYLLATGDEDGYIKIWDYRRQESVMELHDCEDYISDMAIDKDKKILLATSGEGTLTAYNVRAKRMEMQSELMDSELQSVAIIKNGKKAVVGSTEGTLNIFNWGEWGNFCDRFPVRSVAIDCMVPISENVVCIGSMDGKIRAVSINPNITIGVIGSHKMFSVENLSRAHTGDLIASVSHDEVIKFWDVSEIEEPVEGIKKQQRKKLRKEKKQSSANNFFADL